MKNKKAPPLINYNQLKIRNTKYGDLSVQVSNHSTIKELKQNYLMNLRVDIKIEQIRLFCLGKELKDDLFMYSYDIKDEMAI